MSEQKCPTCGSQVRVVGKTTMSYEPIDSSEELLSLKRKIRFEMENITNVQNYENPECLLANMNRLLAWSRTLKIDEGGNSQRTHEMTL